MSPVRMALLDRTGHTVGTDALALLLLLHDQRMQRAASVAWRLNDPVLSASGLEDGRALHAACMQLIIHVTVPVCNLLSLLPSPAAW